MQELFQDHIVKINKIIASCTTHEHILSVRQIVKNFVDYWRWKGKSVNVIRHYLKHFNTLIEFKLRKINYNE